MNLFPTLLLHSFIHFSTKSPFVSVMSRLKIGKKLQPAKKAWKSFSNTVKSRVHKLNISKVIKATIQKILSTFHTLCHLITSKGHNRSLTAIRRTYSSSYFNHAHGRNIPAIHIDELFSEPSFPSSSSSFYSSMHVNAKKSSYALGETSKGKVVVDKKDLAAGGSREMDSIEDAWKAVVAKSPLLQVDERAEEFISKFHQDMKLQKEKSLLEFQEMLARGV